MKRFYIPHKLSIEDITNLSDSESELIISSGKLKEEDLVEIESPDSIYTAQITFIDTASVEVQIKELITAKEKQGELNITVIQSITGERKIRYFLEKITEVGVDRIIPIETTYSQRSLESSRRQLNSWRAVIKEATDQSRNPSPPEIEKPIQITQLQTMNLKGELICLSSEEISKENLTDLIDPETKEYTVAIGPETGWSSEDLDRFKSLNFKFAKLKGNILRTETAGIVACTIIKTIHKEI